MNKLFKRVCSLMICAALLCGCTLANAAGLDWAAGDYLQEKEPVRFRMTAQIESLPPYGDDMVGMMNALLENVEIAGEISADETAMAFRVAGDEVASLTEAQADVGVQLATNLLPNRVLLSGASAMDALSGFEQEEKTFDLFAAIEEAEGCYQELTDAILPYAEEKSASYSIKGVGSSRWSRIARLTPEQGAELSPLIAKVLGCGMDEAFREQLRQMTYQKGFIVGLYQKSQGGDDLAVYIKGNVVFPDGAQRAISYQWAFAVNEKGQRVDTYKFDMTKSATPRDNRQISATYKRSAKADTLLVDGQSKATIRNPEDGTTVTTTITHKLNGTEGAIKGTVTNMVRTAKGETASTVTTTIKPDVLLAEEGDEYLLTGTMRVEQAKGNTTHVAIDLLFGETEGDQEAEEEQAAELYVVTDERLPESSLTQNLFDEPEEPKAEWEGEPPIGYTAYDIPEESVMVELDNASPEEIAVLMDEMAQRLAGRLLMAVAKLPEDASALIRANLSEENYAAFLALLDE